MKMEENADTESITSSEKYTCYPTHLPYYGNYAPWHIYFQTKHVPKQKIVMLFDFVGSIQVYPKSNLMKIEANVDTENISTSEK